MRHRRLVLAVAVPALLAAGGPTLDPPPGPPPLRYRDQVFGQVDKTAAVTYGSAPDYQGQTVVLQLDVYRPAGDTVTRRPAIVWMHGGGFHSGSRTSSKTVDLATTFAKKGYVTVSISYRLRPVDCSPALPPLPGSCIDAITDAMHDAQAAVRFLRANQDIYGVDADRIAIGGASAGAITAMNVGFNPDDPGTSGNPGFSSAVAGAVSLSGGKLLGSADAGEAPSLLFHGTNDSTVPYDLAVHTMDEARAAGLASFLVTWDGGGHLPTEYDPHRQQIHDVTTNFLYSALDLTPTSTTTTTTTSTTTTTTTSPTTTTSGATTTTSGATTTTSGAPTTSGASTTTTATTAPPAGTKYLSDLVPLQAVNGLGPIERDRANGGSAAGDGGPIVLNGVPYTKGLGVNAYSEVEYDITGYQSFRADVGLDDSACTSTARIEIALDGSAIAVPGPSSYATTTATFALNINVAGKTRLKISVIALSPASACDHFDWADARLVGTDTPSTTSTTAPPTTTSTSPTTTTTGSTTTTTTFNPSADTYAKDTAPTTNFGTSTHIGVDGSPVTRPFLKFTLTTLSGRVTSAKLRLHVKDNVDGPSDTGGTLKTMSEVLWSESGVTWNAQPAIDGPTVASLGAVSRNTWVTIDVTAAVTGNGIYSFGMTSSSSNGAFYDSRETSRAPRLIVTTAQ